MAEAEKVAEVEKVAIVGSRAERVDGRLTESSWRRRAMVFDYVEALAFQSKETIIVSGGADGVDSWAAGSGARRSSPGGGLGAEPPTLAPTQLARVLGRAAPSGRVS